MLRIGRVYPHFSSLTNTQASLTSCLLFSYLSDNQKDVQHFYGQTHSSFVYDHSKFTSDSPSCRHLWHGAPYKHHSHSMLHPNTGSLGSCKPLIGEENVLTCFLLSISVPRLEQMRVTRQAAAALH
ncbi:hypothetical protein K435DRAFT_175115 [Dendrothele bispora CBS 962.96]|uniref:Uncharacterized protein n=1 Tax=Dendrothele bispora (strain CBS 962.96) TaxID=1314807 RepID=A0A4S8MZI7_DENBC|nr:hypothetical protein K435DRAFT_175115 [Dendrothele bispora CBS 962.96]